MDGPTALIHNVIRYAVVDLFRKRTLLKRGCQIAHLDIQRSRRDDKAPRVWGDFVTAYHFFTDPQSCFRTYCGWIGVDADEVLDVLRSRLREAYGTDELEQIRDGFLDARATT